MGTRVFLAFDGKKWETSLEQSTFWSKTDIWSSSFSLEDQFSNGLFPKKLLGVIFLCFVKQSRLATYNTNYLIVLVSIWITLTWPRISSTQEQWDPKKSPLVFPLIKEGWKIHINNSLLCQKLTCMGLNACPICSWMPTILNVIHILILEEPINLKFRTV